MKKRKARRHQKSKEKWRCSICGEMFLGDFPMGEHFLLSPRCATKYEEAKQDENKQVQLSRTEA